MERQIFESMTLCPLDGRYSNVKDALPNILVNML